MSFRFTEEDFERYVKKSEHGGRHIWDDLLARLKEEFGMPFGVTTYKRHGDWLIALWFYPKNTPRSSWSHQTQFWLSRNMEQARLDFGLDVECATPEEIQEWGGDSDRDGERLIARLEKDQQFCDLLDRLVREQGFSLGSAKNAAELLAILKKKHDTEYWSVGIQRSLNKEEAIALGEGVANRIMDAFRATRPLFEAVIPDDVRHFIETGERLPSPVVEESSQPTEAVNGVAALRDHLAAQGLFFTPHQIAAFATALQTKGFVILSGISGTGKTKLAQHFAELLRTKGDNHLFVPVRPDWRDSKSLLGYYNPLTETFESTPFLRFLLRVQAHYDEQGLAALPHFVLLDEMNLARVEYYFADFLSVLESGRADDGYSREAITLHSFRQPVEDAEGRPVPASLRLSPNLYIVGAVNVDETTHAFSPKVLDRAFTLEFTEVDLSDYPLPPGDAAPLSDETRRALVQAFTRQGRFAVVDKERVAQFVGTHPIYRDHLAALNDRLRPHDLHFAYRVFDEIMAFLDNVEAAPWQDGFAGPDDAFDTAALMKILPKFHGSRGRLLAPLRAVLAWARQPADPDAVLGDMIQETGTAEQCIELRKRLDGQLAGAETGEGAQFAYPRTARKAARMLRQLHDTGFASFSG